MTEQKQHWIKTSVCDLQKKKTNTHTQRSAREVSTTGNKVAALSICPRLNSERNLTTGVAGLGETGGGEGGGFCDYTQYTEHLNEC